MFYIKFKRETLQQAIKSHGVKDAGFKTLFRAIEAAEDMTTRNHHYDIVKIDGTVVFEKRESWWKALKRRLLNRL